jgi:AAA15 family ATPase/GTPase
LICWEFIRLFSETAPAVHKQLIVTTHEAYLLNQKLLRRDEYWFAEKDGEQQTRLVSLSDFKVRNDLQLENGYLHGRFGGIPIMGPATDLEELLTKNRS